MRLLIETMRLQQKQDAEALIKAQLVALELEQAKETISLLKNKLKIETDKVNDIQSNAFEELLAIRLTKNQLIQEKEELESELSLSHRSRHLLLVQSNESNEKIKDLYEELNEYSKRIRILEEENIESNTKLNEITIEKENLTSSLHFSCLEKEGLERKIVEYEQLLADNKESDIICQSALQAKAASESRTTKLENDIINIKKQRDAAVVKLDEHKRSINTLVKQIEECNNAKDMLIREKAVTSVEIKSYEAHNKQLMAHNLEIQMHNDTMIDQMNKLKKENEELISKQSLFEEEIERISYSLHNSQRQNKELEEELTTVLKQIYTRDKNNNNDDHDDDNDDEYDF